MAIDRQLSNGATVRNAVTYMFNVGTAALK
jgi:hypothetical protein